MITCKLVGGLGNQLFQIANCIAYCKRYGFEYQIPQTLGDYKKYAIYMKHLPVLTSKFEDFGYLYEQGFTYREIPKREQVCLIGYFQSWKYFWDQKEEVFAKIREGFSQIELLKIPYDYTGRVSVHVRRGDYVEYRDIHPPVTLEYIKKAVTYLNDRGYYRYTVYSDDIDWCRENMGEEFFPGCVFEFVSSTFDDPVKDALFDMYTMSRHDHQIISNSTFSLWAALLNTDPEKIVVAPANGNWFGADTEYDAIDIMPDNYIRIAY